MIKFNHCLRNEEHEHHWDSEQFKAAEIQGFYAKIKIIFCSSCFSELFDNNHSQVPHALLNQYILLAKDLSEGALKYHPRNPL